MIIQRDAVLFICIKQNQESTVSVDQFSRIEDLRRKVVSMAIDSLHTASVDQYYNLFFEIIQPNIELRRKVHQQ